MKIDWAKSKAYGGGVGGFGTFIASQTFLDRLTTILAWLLSYLGNPPVEVAQAIAWVIVAVGSFAIGFGVTWIFPPNQPGEQDPANLEALRRHKEQLERITEGLEKGSKTSE